MGPCLRWVRPSPYMVLALCARCASAPPAAAECWLVLPLCAARRHNSQQPYGTGRHNLEVRGPDDSHPHFLRVQGALALAAARAQRATPGRTS